MRSLLAAAALLAATACSGCSASSGDAAPSAAASPTAQTYHATDLRPGDCFDDLAADGFATLVTCEKPHVYEFAGVWVLPDEPWPGDDKVIEASTKGCEEKVRIKKELRDTVTWTAFAPVEATWPRHRTAYCVALSVEEGVKLSGHVLA
ncbi:septum formation family protein [Nonomuraea sp. NPDC050790]|uniref:septum formation family protein n=1 Tax=Nonomuraea sp. NPDC050790 TaxID=3364371 RepID=UPI0037AB4A94